MTALQLSALKPKEATYKVAVETGLELRVAPSGVKTWYVRYMVGGRQRGTRLTRPFGTSTNDAFLSLADARSEAAAIRARARDGIDVVEEKEQARLDALRLKETQREAEEAAREQALRENATVDQLYHVWLRDGVRRSDDNAEIKRSFTADVLPYIGDVPVRALTEHHVRDLLRVIVARDANRAAVLVCASLIQMFSWAEKRQPWRKLLAEGNPMDLIEIEKIVSPDYDMDNERERVLSAQEILELHQILMRMRTEYAAATDRRSAPQPLERTTELALWIMLGTLCRVGETSKARWDQVDFEKNIWYIPKKNTKGKTSNLLVFLSPFTRRQFEELHALTGHTPWCFPNQSETSHRQSQTIAKQVGDRQCRFKKDKEGGERKPMSKRRHDDTLVLANGVNGAWTPHDMRRTGATMMQALKVPLDIIDRCQNHVMRGSKVRRHYLHYDYADEKKEAWRLLGERIEAILSEAARSANFRS